MGGPNLEVFKFGLYLFVPVFALLHFGDPQWYHDNVLPVCFQCPCTRNPPMISLRQYKDRLFPRVDENNRVCMTGFA